MNFKSFNRRGFFKLLPFGLGAPAINVLAQNTDEEHTAGISQSPTPSRDFNPDVELELVATETQAQILPGSPTRLWQY